MTHSMTGFARIETEYAWGRLSCEIRSVNHRYLELNFRMPEALRTVENSFREALKKSLSRGKVEVSLYLKQEQANGATINPQELANLSALLKSAAQHIDNAAPVNVLEALSWPGVLQTQELDTQVLADAASSALADALLEIKRFRAREGAELAQCLRDRLKTIGEHVADLRSKMPLLIQTQQEKLRQKIEALQVDVDQERLTQELVIIAQKSDIAEELDRLDAHIHEAERTLASNKPIGRRLDFIMQEFNREANTLSSKAIASGITQVAVELKVLIEQMREQVQNIE